MKTQISISNIFSLPSLFFSVFIWASFTSANQEFLPDFDSSNFLAHRQLDFNITASDTCKQSCIDVGRNFCPQSNYKSGLCCDILSPNCTSNDICSNDVSVTNMKLWACPSEVYCGDVLVTPFANGTSFNISINTTASYRFSYDKICKYLVSFPDIAGLNDNIQIVPTYIYNVEATFMSGVYYSNDVTRLNMVLLRTYSATFPNKVFLLVRSSLANSVGQFTFRVQFINNPDTDKDQAARDQLKNISINGQDISNQQKLNDFLNTFNKTNSGDSDSLTKTNIIIIAVLGGAFVVLVIVVIVLVVYCKRKTDQVETLSKRPQSSNDLRSTQNGPMRKANFASHDDYESIWKSQQFQDQLKAKFGTTEVTPEMIQKFFSGQMNKPDQDQVQTIQAQIQNQGVKNDGHSLVLDTMRDSNNNISATVQLLNQNKPKSEINDVKQFNQTLGLGNNHAVSSGQQLTNFDYNSDHQIYPEAEALQKTGIRSETSSQKDKIQSAISNENSATISQSYNKVNSINQQSNAFSRKGTLSRVQQEPELYQPQNQVNIGQNNNQEEPKKKRLKSKKSQGSTIFDAGIEEPAQMQFNIVSSDAQVQLATQKTKKSMKQDKQQIQNQRTTDGLPPINKPGLVNYQQSSTVYQEQDSREIRKQAAPINFYAMNDKQNNNDDDDFF
ncbi:UNKNOWN [Stylonychia lemnae]|uniref:Transmembrane protein n=1 Tax=Stylonychia lemnae TaxID=5949 RepID=A0A078A6E5_STYLE|nr:UNKNOWN [Stylonychia lemnae]|eukprot:CDW77774.1 UNKNOWN [Stylonychia lemnae]